MGKSTKRALRRFQAETHMKRRLSEDRNQHRSDIDQRSINIVTGELMGICPCYYDPKAMARFKEQPKWDCKCSCCRYITYAKYHDPTIQEIKSDIDFEEELNEYRDNISRIPISG
ncbi:MAG TPA: hypothetical protein VNX68_15570 [Nitrosopumilaceae archaeon]|jgi:hypothetical protein|nr:hypothetical protein [Nitrosopumilaceae archaeon]